MALLLKKVNFYMKKFLLLLLSLCFILTACQSSGGGKAPKEIKDPKILSQFWEDYIDDCPFTISSSFSSWDDPSEIEPLALCNYLFLKMQRNSDMEDTNFDELVNNNADVIWIKADKLSKYHRMYFTKDFNYRTINSAGCYYDEKSDSVVLSTAYLIAQLPAVTYDSFDEYPNFSLEKLEILPDNILKATVASVDFRLSSQKEKGKIYQYMYFELSEDETCRHISAQVDIKPLKGSFIKGNFKKLPFIKDLDKYTSIGPIGSIVPLFGYNNDGLTVLKADIEKGTIEQLSTIPLRSEHSESNIILRSGRVLLIETTYELADDKTINTQKPNVYLSEILLNDGSVREIEIPKDCSYIADISGDFGKMLYKERMDGDFCIYDFNEKKTTVIEDTAPILPKEDDPNGLFAIETFGHGQFTDDKKKLVLYKFGYEWGAGYTIYDILSKSSVYYPVKTIWGGFPIMTPYGLYIGEIDDGDENSYKHGFLSFKEGSLKELPTVNFPENFRYSYVPNGESRYIPMLMPINQEDYLSKNPSGLSEMALAVFDSQSLSIKDTGVRLNRPPFYPCIIYTLPDGNMYISDSEISTENAFLVENPFIK